MGVNFSGIYLTCTMAITTLSMVLTVLVLNLNSIHERPVPNWMQVLVFQYLSPLFCKGRYVSATSDDDADDVTCALPMRDTAERLANYNRSNNIFANTSMTPISDVTLQQTSDDVIANGSCAQDSNLVTSETTTSFATSLTPLLRSDGQCRTGRSVSWSESKHDVTTSTRNDLIQQQQQHDLQHNNTTNSNRKSKMRFRSLSPKQLERDVSAQQSLEMTSPFMPSAVRKPEAKKEQDFSKDWQRLAEVVDRIFFWLFLIAITVVSLLLFHPLAKDYVDHRSH